MYILPPSISKKIEGYRWQSSTPPAAGKSRRFRGLICHRRSHLRTASRKDGFLRPFTDGYRESEQSWREVLLDLKRRSLGIGPELVTGDGALGFWKALRQVYGAAREQRCWVHKNGQYLE